MEAIRLEFEHVSYKGKEIHFNLPAGYIMGIMGENGAGKTTLLNHIISDEKRYGGIIRIDGQDISVNRNWTKQNIGFVSEDNPFFQSLRGYTNARMLGKFYDGFDENVFEEAAKRMNVPLENFYNSMSRGEKMKFQMAFAMAHKPSLYILDEVTAGMDPVYRLEFWNELQRLVCDENASVIMTSQIESEMERKADYLGIMKDGAMICFGESMDVLKEMRLE